LSSAKVLNPRAAAPELEAVELSGRILGAVRSAPESDERAELDQLTAQLNGTDPGTIEGDAARTAFWINVYNALLLHRLILRPTRGNILLKPRIFSASGYGVGGDDYSLNQIEHGVLRCNSRPPMQPRRPFRGSDPRLRSLPSRLDPRIHFALNCGARSCPPVRVYDSAEVDAELERATNSYLQTEAEIDVVEGSVSLPGLMGLYAADFGSRDEQMAFAATHLPALADLFGRPVKVRYTRFDWTATPS
jgi:hypothetical protein